MPGWAIKINTIMQVFKEEEYMSACENSDEEYTDEEYTDEEDDDEDPTPYFLRDCILDNKIMKLYKCTARDFIPYIRTWGAQRALNKKHVVELTNQLSKSKRLIGTFKIVISSNGETRCIDGQHRISAIYNIMEKDSMYDLPIIIEAYPVPELESQETAELFREANNTLNISEHDMPDIGAQLILKELVLEFPNFIIDPKTINGRVNRPRINKKELYVHLKSLTKDFKWKSVLDAIRHVNIRLGITSSRQSNFSKKIFDKAKQGGFYLGLTKQSFEWLALVLPE